jgi:predicted transposase/invertase (TIGR01784 family)
MRTVAQKYIEEGEARGIHIGKVEGKAELVKLLLKNGNSVGSIAKMTGMSINKINELLKMQ